MIFIDAGADVAPESEEKNRRVPKTPPCATGKRRYEIQSRSLYQAPAKGRNQGRPL